MQMGRKSIKKTNVEAERRDERRLGGKAAGI